jgi:hypothetical protein
VNLHTFVSILLPYTIKRLLSALYLTQSCVYYQFFTVHNHRPQFVTLDNHAFVINNLQYTVIRFLSVLYNTQSFVCYQFFTVGLHSHRSQFFTLHNHMFVIKSLYLTQSYICSQLFTVHNHTFFILYFHLFYLSRLPLSAETWQISAISFCVCVWLVSSAVSFSTHSVFQKQIVVIGDILKSPGKNGGAGGGGGLLNQRVIFFLYLYVIFTEVKISFYFWLMSGPK